MPRLVPILALRHGGGGGDPQRPPVDLSAMREAMGVLRQPSPVRATIRRWVNGDCGWVETYQLPMV